MSRDEENLVTGTIARAELGKPGPPIGTTRPTSPRHFHAFFTSDSAPKTYET